MTVEMIVDGLLKIFVGLIILLVILTILLVWGGLVASVVLLQVLSVPTDEETEAAQRAIEDTQAAKL